MQPILEQVLQQLLPGVLIQAGTLWESSRRITQMSLRKNGVELSWLAGAQFVHQHRVGQAGGTGPTRPGAPVPALRNELQPVANHFPFQQALVQLKANPRPADESGSR